MTGTMTLAGAIGLQMGTNVRALTERLEETKKGGEDEQELANAQQAPELEEQVRVLLAS